MAAGEPTNFDLLDVDHEGSLERALVNILSTEAAEFTYAQILDGLPTEQSLNDSFGPMPGHPVHELKHTTLCEGSIEKARSFRDRFTLRDLKLETPLLLAFQNETKGTEQFSLRLIELVVVACHQIAAYLYGLDDGPHKHEVYEGWLNQKRSEAKAETDFFYRPPPPAAFCHRNYKYFEQYPQGIADVVGYWAEGKIFGGVVVFDRGESERECKAMWIHGALDNGPRTLYPPTPGQFTALVDFLLADEDRRLPCPLPIHGTPENRPRWEPNVALADFHIFRDKYERKVWRPGPRDRVLKTVGDWPEMRDEYFLEEQSRIGWAGGVVDMDAYEAAKERLKQVTPSSPCWIRWRNR